MHTGFFSKILLRYRIYMLAVFIVLTAGLSLYAAAIYPFVWNLLAADRQCFVICIIILSAVNAVVCMMNIIPDKKVIENVNRLNLHYRNTLLTVYELQSKENINKTEREFIESVHFSRPLNLLSCRVRDVSLRIFYSAVIMALAVITFFPVFVSNAAGLTRKHTIIKPGAKKEVNIISYNLGSISGKLKDSRGENYKAENKYSRNDFIYFKGPGVRSNALDIRYIKKDIIDSLRIYSEEPQYTGAGIDTFFSSSIDIKQYSRAYAVVFSSFAGNVNIGINNGNPIYNDIKDTFHMHSDSIIISINVQDDRYPACRIEESMIKGPDYQYITIPVIVLDDLGIDYAGIEIKREQKTDIYRRKDADSLFFFVINSDSLNADKTEIRAFVKDNNPFKEQITYSSALIIRKDTSVAVLSADTLISSELIGENDELKNRIHNIRSNLLRNNLEKASKQFSNTMKKIEKYSSRLDSTIRDISSMRLENQVLKKLTDIKERVQNLDSEILKQINADMKTGKLNEMSGKELKDYLEKNISSIEDALDKMEQMLEELEKMSSLNRLKKEIDRIIEKQRDAITQQGTMFRENQQRITEDLRTVHSSMQENTDLNDLKSQIQETAEMSEAAEDNMSKSTEVEQKLKKISEDITKKMNNMTGKSDADADMIIKSLYAANIYLRDNQPDKSLRELYSRLYSATTGKSGKPQPLSAMISRIYRLMGSEDVTGELLISENFRIISYILSKKEGSSGQGQSMQQMMQSVNSMTKKQQMIMQALQNIMKQGKGMQQMMNEIAGMQKDMAGTMRQLSGQDSGNNMLGDMESLADTLEDLSQELYEGRIDSNMINRQKRLLNRMLNLEKSVYRKKISPERKSKPGRDYSAKEDIVLPEDLGFSKYEIRELLYRYLKEYRETEYIPSVRKYYMEILR